MPSSCLGQDRVPLNRRAFCPSGQRILGQCRAQSRAGDPPPARWASPQLLHLHEGRVHSPLQAAVRPPTYPPPTCDPATLRASQPASQHAFLPAFLPTCVTLRVSICLSCPSVLVLQPADQQVLSSVASQPARPWPLSSALQPGRRLRRPPPPFDELDFVWSPLPAVHVDV